MSNYKRAFVPGGEGITTAPYAEVSFEGPTIIVTAGVSFCADVTGMVPEEVIAEFWSRFWNADIADDIEACMETFVADKVGLDAPALRNVVDAASGMLAARFEACGGSALVA